ncbi:MAG: hypothetical protein JWP81_1995 [Ferruginibacter sp.]|nr:hypothetical protein [Ferruginibacter sp.]
MNLIPGNSGRKEDRGHNNPTLTRGVYFSKEMVQFLIILNQ